MPEIYLSNCTADVWEIIILFIIQMNEETVDGVWGFLDTCLSSQLFRKVETVKQISRDTSLPLLSPWSVPRSLLSMQIQEIKPQWQGQGSGSFVDIWYHLFL